MNKISELVRLLNKDWSIIKLQDWTSYIKYPIWDWIMYPELYNLVIDLVIERIVYIDDPHIILIGEEDLWWHIVPLIASKLQNPYAFMRWGTLWLLGEISISFENLYTKWFLHINDLKSWTKVIIIEDIIDTGGTMIAMINGLKSAGIEIIDVISVCDRPEKWWRKRIKKMTGIIPKVLVSMTICNNKLKCTIAKDIDI